MLQRYNYTFLKKYLTILCFGAFLFTLFVIFGQIPDNAVVAKRFYFTAVIFIVSIISLGFLVKNEGLKLSFRDFLLVFFLLLTSLFVYINDDFHQTRYEIFQLLAVLYVCCRVIFSSYKKSIEILTILLLLCGIGQIGIGVSQVLGFSKSLNSNFSITGTFFNPGPYSAFIAASFALAVGLLSRIDYKSNDYMKSAQFWVAGTCALLSIIIIPSTMSRSAWISIVAVLLIIACKELIAKMLLERIIQRFRLNTFIGLTLVVAITLSLFAGMYYMKKDSADGRVLIWKNTISLIKENPITGVGFGHFGVEYGNRQAKYFSSAERNLDEIRVAGVPQFAFNDFLQMTAEQGIPLTLLFIAFIIFVIISLVKSRSILLYPLLTLLIFSLTSYPLNVLPIAIVFVLITASTTDRSYILINNRKINMVIFSLLMVIGIFVSGRQFINNTDKYKAYKDWSGAQILYNMQYFEEATKDYKKKYVHLKDQEKFLFEYGRSLNQIKEFEESNQILLLGTKISGDPMFYNVMGNNYKSLGLFKEAEASYKRAYYGVPNRLYPLYLLAKLYYDTGQHEEFYIYSDKVLNFDPKVISPATREIKSEIRELADKYCQENEKEIKK